MGAGLLAALFIATAVLAGARSPRNSADGPIRWDSLGTGSWQAARTANGGRDILIKLVGSPEWKADDPCSVAYHVQVTEAATQVRLRLGGSSPPDRRPPPPAGSGYGCAAVGYDRSITAHLARPLGSRQVIEAQFNRIQPVFDGDTLARIGWLPEGWHQISEGGFTVAGGPLRWSRTFGPNRRASAGRPCVPTDARLALSEGPADRTGSPPTSGDDVHGTNADYQQHDARGASLLWIEHSRLYVVSSTALCDGDTLPSKDTMLRFARALQIP